MKIDQTAVLGAGVIGASWTSLFLAAGMRVNGAASTRVHRQRLADAGSVGYD